MQKDEIIQKLINGQSVLLVGPTDSGKTYFALNEVLPALKSGGKKVAYLKDCDQDAQEADIYIIDEVETLFDKEFLENLHPEENPYYEPSYSEKVAKWNEKLGNISKPALYIITRNQPQEIQNLVQKMNQTDWGQKITVIPFSRN